MPLHPVLSRQLRKLLIEENKVPDRESWEKLLERISQTYAQADQDRYMLERSLSVCSTEMTALYEDLRKRSEAALASRAQALEESLALADAIQDAVAHGILVTDTGGNVLSTNKRFRELWRLPDSFDERDDAGLVAHSLEAVVNPDALRATMIKVIEDPTASFSDDVHMRDGRILHRLTSPVKMPDGTTRGRVWLFRDATEERKLASRQMVVAERMAAVGQLVASVAHEINNPLAAILGNIEFVREVLGEHDEQTPQILDALKDAREGLDRVRVIVRDLRTLSRTDVEAHEALDVNAVLESALSTAKNQIRHRASVVRTLGRVPRVDGNAARMHQVFLNLLMNAAQAIPEGRASENTIEVATWTERDRVFASVRDTGCGIPDDSLDRIFDAFYTTKPMGFGTGLGLSIAKGIVEKLGGTIRVETKVGAGSRFVLDFPRSSVVDSAARSEEPAPERSPALRILVVDDEILARRWISRALSGEHSLTLVGSVDEAVEALQMQGPFDVIICDVMMPDRTGRDLYLHVEAKHPELLASILFLTGGAFTGELQAFLDRIPNPKLEKPITVASLRAAVFGRGESTRASLRG
jgi:signal transduction histidine kinase